MVEHAQSFFFCSLLLLLLLILYLSKIIISWKGVSFRWQFTFEIFKWLWAISARFLIRTVAFWWWLLIGGHLGRFTWHWPAVYVKDQYWMEKWPAPMTCLHWECRKSAARFSYANQSCACVIVIVGQTAAVSSVIIRSYQLRAMASPAAFFPFVWFISRSGGNLIT